MSAYGIKVAKSGSSVYSTDVNDYVMNSAYVSRSVRGIGTVNLTTNENNTWAEATVTHNFGYYPQIDAYTDLVNASVVTLPGYYSFNTGKGPCGGTGVSYYVEQFRVKITDTTIVFGARYFETCVVPMVGSTETWKATTYTIKYKIYMEAVELP